MPCKSEFTIPSRGIDSPLEERVPSQIREYTGIGHRNSNNLARRRLRRGASSVRRTQGLARPPSSESQRIITRLFSIQFRVGGVLSHPGGFSARASGRGLTLPCQSTVSDGSAPNNGPSGSRGIIHDVLRRVRDTEGAQDLQKKDNSPEEPHKGSSKDKAPLSEKS